MGTISFRSLWTLIFYVWDNGVDFTDIIVIYSKVSLALVLELKSG